MREDELCTLTWDDIANPSLNNPYAWRYARRNRLAVTMLARQIALKEAGTMADEYFAKYRARLLAEAKDIIATSRHFKRWRFPQG